MEQKEKKLSKITIVTIALYALAGSLYLLAVVSKGFSNLYVNTAYRLISTVVSFVTGIFPFSLGEIVLVMIIIISIAIFIYVIGCFIYVFKCMGTDEGLQKIIRTKEKMAKLLKGIMFFSSVAILIMVLNCFILYRASGFADMYLNKKESYSKEELRELRNMVVNKCNELCKQVERGSDGNLAYSKNVDAEAIKQLKALGKDYKRLSGYYPGTKKILFSEFMSQQYVSGVFFPFTMEANINNIMKIGNYPATVCHELAHLKGFILEDEANFIAYLACINSDDIFFQYSGYLSVLYYLDEAYAESLSDEREYVKQPFIDPVVVFDNAFLSEETWKKVESNAIVSTDKVVEISDSLTDTSLKSNGVEEGIESYNMVVEMLLAYYYGK